MVGSEREKKGEGARERTGEWRRVVPWGDRLGGDVSGERRSWGRT